MIVSAKQLIGLRVETKSGQYLGRIRDFEIDADTLEILRLFIRPVGIIKGFAAGDLIIAKSSVVSVDKEKMIVLDLVGEELTGAKQEKKPLAMEGAAISVSNLE